MDAPQSKQVEKDGQQDDQEAAREQIVVVDEGHTPPVTMASPDHLLPDVSAGMKTNRSSEKGAGWGLLFLAFLTSETGQ